MHCHLKERKERREGQENERGIWESFKEWVDMIIFHYIYVCVCVKFSKNKLKLQMESSVKGQFCKNDDLLALLFSSFTNHSSKAKQYQLSVTGIFSERQNGATRGRAHGEGALIAKGAKVPFGRWDYYE